MHGFIKAAALSPRVTVANPALNGKETLDALLKAAENGVQLAVLPELGLSAYTCADLFYQDTLIRACEAALSGLLEKTAHLEIAYAVGLPVRAGLGLYDCAAVCQSGKILGVVPKTYLANSHESGEKRWFLSGGDSSVEEVTLCGQTVPFGQQLFRFGELVVGVEIGEDLLAPVPVSSGLCLAGANVILNLSASAEMVSRKERRLDLIAGQSTACLCGYVSASAGLGESTTDLVFSGACVAAEKGRILAEGERFSWNGSSAAACIDIWKLMSDRRGNGTFADAARMTEASGLPVTEGTPTDLPEEKIDRVFDPAPFIPADPAARAARCREIVSIQAVALARRMSHVGAKKLVIGISGGLDSTLALLICAESLKMLGLPSENILAVTMPGFGTTDHTYQNALELIASLGATFMEIDIRPACLQHMKDIGHDASIHDITYENTQARQRTYLLMDLANKHGGLLVGTGDLSEMAMGWCTYNGDHMSMYGVNASIPKTLIRHVTDYVASQSDERTAAVLRRVLDTPVSPELLPPDEQGNIKQKTEDTIGPYELHDFFIYHFMRFGCTKEKLRFLALRAFDGRYDEATVDKWLAVFMKRFFISQFKRSCMPDGPKVGSVGVSPRGDWQMPSDANFGAWMA